MKVSDIAFLLAKLRVVQARNDLSDLAFDLATKQSEGKKLNGKLKPLLHLSGEALTLPGFKLLVSRMWPIVLLYITTPVTIATFKVCLSR